MPTMPAARPIISLSHVTLEFEHGIQALRDVTLDVAPGERICVLGPNGSGKSTLASVLCGLLAPDEGEVELVGERVFGPGGADFDAYRRARRQIGLVFQNPDDQIVTSIVEEDVAFGPENLGVDPKRIGPLVASKLHRVGLDRFAKADPNHLSGGQKQRVAIAGALAMEPQVLVLDEPGALLDVRGRRGIMRVMARLRTEGRTAVHVTHFMEEALAADRVVVLDGGRLVLEGTPEEVFAHGKQLAALGLEEPFVARLAEALRAKEISVPWTCDEQALISSIEKIGVPEVGAARRPGGGRGCSPSAVRSDLVDTLGESAAEEERPLLPPGRRAPAVDGSAPAVRASNLTYSYGEADNREERHPALARVSFAIPRGSTAAIVGQTGSGKSTLLRLICALEAPDAGTLVVDGLDTARRRQRRQLHGRVGYVMQHPERQLFAETVWEDVAYGPSNPGLSASEIERRCTRALALVGLTGREQTSPFHLSGGQQRLCALAGILAMEPQILVLDEPTAGLDPRGRSQLRSILGEIRTHGTTIIQVTHSMNDAAAAEQVVVLSKGTLLMQGAPAEVFRAEHEQLLREHGLGLPDALAWALRLEAAGMPSLGQPLTLDALATSLHAALAHAGGVARWPSA